MADKAEGLDITLICVIVNFGQASKLIRFAKHHGITGATVVLGTGTVCGGVLDFLGLSDTRKEIIYLAAEREIAYRALEELNREFEFNKPHRGIAFTTPICGIMGTKNITCHQNGHVGGVNQTMYQIITTIVERGKAEDVVTAAQKAGSKGGTILNARGSGVHETEKLFSMEIEPEKEIVLILSEREQTERIIESIKTALKLDEPGNGIIYVQSAEKTYGIYQ